MKYFAGVGSRKVIQHAPELEPILKAITQCLNDQGYTLRSGGAEGCDKWFEAGARDDMKEIFYAGDATEESLKIASEIHPAWHRCSEWAQNLHGRNVFQVLGKDLQTPVDFLICWTQYGKIRAERELQLCLPNNVIFLSLILGALISTRGI